MSFKRRMRRHYQMGGYYDPNAEENSQIDSGLTAGVSAINPLWGALAQAGSKASSQIRGDGTDTTRAIGADVVDPWNQFKNNKSAGDWAGSFLVPGYSITKGSRQAREAREAQIEQNRTLRNEMTNRLNTANLNGYATEGYANTSIYEKGGRLKPLNSDTVEVDGATHAEGGVQIPQFNAEVEDKETIAGDYVFSDKLGFAERHKPIARGIGKIEKKPLNNERRVSLEILRKREAALKMEQETIREELGLFESVERQMGGSLRRPHYDAAYDLPTQSPFGQNDLTTGQAFTEPQGTPPLPSLSLDDWRYGRTANRDFKEFPLRTDEIKGWTQQLLDRRANKNRTEELTQLASLRAKREVNTKTWIPKQYRQPVY